MLKPLAAVGALLLLGSYAHALSPQALDYVHSVAPSISDEDIKIADEAGTIQTTYHNDPVQFSLESLAAQKKQNAVIAFITMRVFIQHLQDDFDGTKIPTAYYDAMYLTPAEKSMVGRKYLAMLDRQRIG